MVCKEICLWHKHALIKEISTLCVNAWLCYIDFINPSLITQNSFRDRKLRKIVQEITDKLFVASRVLPIDHKTIVLILHWLQLIMPV